MNHKREITEKEWREYKWIELVGGECLRGVKFTDPPNDGYHYIEVTTIADLEQKWVRAFVYEED